MPRQVRIATTCQRGRFAGSVEGNIEGMCRVLAPVWAQEPDLVCLPENFATVGVEHDVAGRAEPAPGRITERFAALACEHRCYIICPFTRADAGRYMNSAVILDRTGEVAGIYDKIHPVTCASDYTSMEHGITPGATDVPVFDLDVGRIGIQICFDIEFPESWRALEGAGAELVVWPSAYDGGFPLSAYAYLHGYYVVSAVRSAHSRIINPLGEVLDRTGTRLNYVVRTVDLDYIVCHNDFHHGLIEELSRAYGSGVSVRQRQESGRMLIQSEREDLTLSAVIARFGLVSRREYIQRHRDAYEPMREGGAPAAQSPAFLGRPPYSYTSLAEWERIRATGQE